MILNRIALLRKPKFTYNLAILKDYGGCCYKLTRCKCVRTKGIEDDTPPVPKGSVNDTKLENNLIRARTAIREYGYCNPWEWFVTMTINPAFFDRFDLGHFRKVLFQWIRDYNKKYDIHVKVLLVPEKHKDGAWHMHGFLMGLPIDHLVPFSLDDHIPYYILDKLKKDQPVYNWLAYASKFGWFNAEPIHSREKATNYITKYITKDVLRSVPDLGKHCYFVSHGLKRAQEMARGTMDAPIVPQFENEFCKVNWFDGKLNSCDDLLQLIKPSLV